MKNMNRGQKWFSRFIAAAVLIAVLPAAACSEMSIDNRYVDTVRFGEGNAPAGKIDWGDRSDRQGSLAFSVNVHVTVSEKTQIGNLIIINPHVNDMFIKAEYYLKDSPDTPIYTSPEIPPNHFIEMATLSAKLEKGEYNAVCYLLGFTDGKSPEYVGKVGVNVKISVI